MRFLFFASNCANGGGHRYLAMRSAPTAEQWCYRAQGDHIGQHQTSLTPVVGAGSIQPTDKTGRMGVMYVRSLLAQAGVINNEVASGEDHLAVDLTLVFPVGPVTVQVKAGTTEPNNDGSITVSIAESWRRKWAQTITPVFLIYVRLEKDSPTDWVEHGDLHTLLHAHAHWLKVNELSGANVRVPLANRLTVETFGQWVSEFDRFGKAASG